jgi:hypothetical protein
MRYDDSAWQGDNAIRISSVMARIWVQEIRQRQELENETPILPTIDYSIGANAMAAQAAS